MSAASASAQAGQHLVLASADQTPSPAAALGLNVDPVPLWAQRLLTPPLLLWLSERWDPATRVFEFLATDRLKMSLREKTRSVTLEGLAPAVALEVLTGLATDGVAGKQAAAWAIRTLVRAAATGAVGSLLDLDDTAMANTPGADIRRWRMRLQISGADTESEWDRDEIRLPVLKPGARATLRVGEITQPWLRDLLVRVLRVRVHGLSEGTLGGWTLSVARLSRFLRTRSDGGRDPRMLAMTAMDQWTAAMRADCDITAKLHRATLDDVSAVLSQARALGISDRYALPAGFALHTGHYPQVAKVIREERSFPDATFRFLLGADDLLGPRVLDLARSVPGEEFSGEAFVTALHLAANFGRRPEELCSLPAHRLRVGDTGAAELLYTNFKSGRDKVWLPVDAHTAEFVRGWIMQVRARYPATPFSELALLPAPAVNPSGTRPTASRNLSTWFRRWVTLLEQAIVLGHLHQATGVPLTTLCRLRCWSLAGQILHVDDMEHALPPAVAQIVVDYRADLIARLGARMHAPTASEELPLFPDVFTQPGLRPMMAKLHAEFVPVSAERFDSLGQGWLPIAASYPGGGIPGFNLGASRINPDLLQVRLFRHTYLQHLVNLGADIFLVQELADHSNVQTTINSYVRVQDEKLREAVDLLAAHRLNTYGQPATNGLLLASAPARDIGTNDCTNPQVLALGREGCEYDRMCFGCDHFAADPSNIPDIKTEIHTCSMTLQRLQIEGDSDLKPHHVAVLNARRDGWRRMLTVLSTHLDALTPTEREQVETAATIVRDFRTRVRSGGLNLGGNATTMPTAVLP
jgi:integrase-like protein